MVEEDLEADVVAVDSRYARNMLNLDTFLFLCHFSLVVVEEIAVASEAVEERQEEVVEHLVVAAAAEQEDSKAKQSSLSLIVTMAFLLLAARKTHLSHLTWCQDQKFTAKREFLLR